MRGQGNGSACQRLQAVLDEALSEGLLSLPPELSAHLSRCPRCSAEYAQTTELLTRLRGAAAGINLLEVPKVVDHVMSQTASQSMYHPRRTASLSWAVGQVATVAAIVLLVTGGLAYGLLKVNQAVSGTHPSVVVDRLLAPFQDWTGARLRNSK